MTERISIGSPQVARVIYDLVEQKIAPGTGMESGNFWSEPYSTSQV